MLYPFLGNLKHEDLGIYFISRLKRIMGTTKKFDQLKLFIGILFNEKVDLAELEKCLEQKFGTIDYKSEVMAFTHSEYYYQEMGQPLFKYFISFADLVKVEDLASIKLTTNDLEAEFAASSSLICGDLSWGADPKVKKTSFLNYFSLRQQGLFSYIYIAISRLISRNCNIKKLKISALPKAMKKSFDFLKSFGSASTMQGSSRQVNLDPGVMSLHNLMLLTTKNFAHRVPIKDGIYIEVTLLWQKSEFQDLPWTYPDFKSAEYKAILKKIRSMYNKKGSFPKN